MKWLCWKSFGCPMPNILPNALSWTDDMTTLSMLNESRESVDGSIGCCSIDWLMQLQQPSCPLVRLLILGLLALPVYNAILIVVGWRLHCSVSSSAERLVVDSQGYRPVKRQAPSPPLAPKPPPRLRRHKATETPSSSSLVLWYQNPHLSQENPFDEDDNYKDLRENLKMVLGGLQNAPLPLPPQTPIFVPPLVEPLTPSESLTPTESPRRGNQKQRSKLLSGILKHLGINSIRKRWKTHASRKKITTSPSSASLSNSSCIGNSSFYVY
ncbi:uncharacterized protein LOC27208228 [Drosophila simulans]|uniref:Uncharacterized protein n=1 Tax=Drosophila simulans TaxID=7240 RepID=A0A0J9RMU8_DROSI|nr:uncharacterized protein LOC27208228 [Drosophila simulans]KMY97241.1 uncharacterized protein Dsimw501_GD28380 [Drosophila simulans]